MTVMDYSGLSKVKPEKSLLETLKKNSGRNSYGRITVRHRGGGNKKKYRIIDFKRDKMDMPATVLTIEYDPNRSANIALLEYEDKERRYIIAPNGLKVGDVLYSSATADIKPGNALPLKNIPVGTFIHNVELYPGKGAQLARAAGIMAQLMAKENGMAQVRLPSGEVRYIRENCKATIGQVGNTDHANIPLGTIIHNIELYPGKGAQLVRSAGGAAQLMAKEGEAAQVRLPSGEVRYIRMNCTATIGQVGNIDYENVQIGKAGRTRHRGFRPTVRGSVMNPCDHPHGGGEGKSPIGRPSPVTPWGKPTMGYKTRKTKNRTDKQIVRRRNGK